MKKLPKVLAQRIQEMISIVDVASLKMASADLTSRYQHAKSIQTDLHRYAYVASRLPATYGVLCHVLEKISPFLQECTSYIDIGSGVGSSLWAASEHIPHVSEATLIEKDTKLVELGTQLAEINPSSIEVTRITKDISQFDFHKHHDISLASYVLNELSETSQLNLIQKLYGCTNKLLILIEPGTPAGFKNVLAARSQLIKLGANVLAPCPHNLCCPLEQAFKANQDWCHFSVRIHREVFHQRSKKGTLPYEDEKYCYLVASPTFKRISSLSRIIKAPIKKSGHILLDLCQLDGQETRVIISRKMKHIYSLAKKSSWGDTWDKAGLIDETSEQS